jgi:hypothetical protein
MKICRFRLTDYAHRTASFLHEWAKMTRWGILEGTEFRRKCVSRTGGPDGMVTNHASVDFTATKSGIVRAIDVEP